MSIYKSEAKFQLGISQPISMPRLYPVISSTNPSAYKADDNKDRNGYQAGFPPSFNIPPPKLRPTEGRNVPCLLDPEPGADSKNPAPNSGAGCSRTCGLFLVLVQPIKLDSIVTSDLLYLCRSQTSKLLVDILARLRPYSVRMRIIGAPHQ
jgi:hypothetical protein